MAYNLYDIEKLPISELRKLCAVEKIEFPKDAKADDLVKLLNVRRKGRKLARLVSDENQEIPNGYVRIKAALSADGSDSPIPVMVNNFRTWIPRGVLVDIPKEARDVLRESVEVKVKQVRDNEGQQVVRTVEVQCYPFETYGEAAGHSGAIRPSGDIKNQRLREQYREKYGRWPDRKTFIAFRDRFMEESERSLIKDMNEQEEA